MFEVFANMRQLRELLWYLAEALTMPSATPIHSELSLALTETERHTLGSPEALMELDVAAHRQSVNVLLQRTSELIRAQRKGIDYRAADLRGAKLNRAYLTTRIFLIQAQLDAAKGDLDTKLPQSLTHPQHWPPTS